MGRAEDCAKLIREGKPPSEIATYLGVSYISVVEYLYRAVGNDLISITDIVLTLPLLTRQYIEFCLKENMGDRAQFKMMCSRQVRNDVELYLYRLRHIYIGDMYFMICNLEMMLHLLVKRVLMKEFSKPDDAWWVQGISEGIRQKCIDTMNRTNAVQQHPFFYITFLQLAKTMKFHWNMFEKYFPDEISITREDMMLQLEQVNRIRNKVMHPSNSGVIQDDDDYHTVRHVHRVFLDVVESGRISGVV